MLKKLAGMVIILGLLPAVGVTCGEVASPTATPLSTVTQTTSPLGEFGEEPPVGLAVYQNEEHGFSFWYPEGWQQYSLEGIDEEVEFFTGFRDSAVDDFKENIVVMVPPYGDVSLASLVDVLGGGYQAFGALVSDTSTTVNGEDGHEWVLSWPSGGGLTFAGQKQRLVVLNAKGGWYQLTCSALEDQYDAHKDTCETIINSFKIE